MRGAARGVGGHQRDPHLAAAQRFMPGIRLVRTGVVRQCQGTAIADWKAVPLRRRLRSGVIPPGRDPGGAMETPGQRVLVVTAGTCPPPGQRLPAQGSILRSGHLARKRPRGLDDAPAPVA